jgi:hypothetical protein
VIKPGTIVNDVITHNDWDAHVRGRRRASAHAVHVGLELELLERQRAVAVAVGPVERQQH